MRKRKTGRETERLVQFQVFVSSDGLHIHCFSSMHIFFFLPKILPTSANTKGSFPTLLQICLTCVWRWDQTGFDSQPLPLSELLIFISHCLASLGGTLTNSQA